MIDPVHAALSQHAETINKNARLFQQFAQATNQRFDRAATEQMQENLIKVGAGMYEKSVAYSNVIMAAGYAGLFGVWSLTKPLLQPGETRFIAFCLVLSLSVFALWEVVKMISAGTLAASFGDFVELRPDQVPGALAQFQAKQRRAELLNAKAWPAVLVVTIVPGLLAAGTLLAAFARPMLQG